jgi:hypothetical protein
MHYAALKPCRRFRQHEFGFCILWLYNSCPDEMRGNNLMRATYAAAALIGLFSASAMAQTAAPAVTAPPVTEVHTAAELAAVCDPAMGNPLRMESIAYCQGYVTAAGHYYAATHPAGTGAQPIFCSPTPPPSVAQTGLAFATWTRENPQYAGEPAIDGLWRWAKTAYPCPEKPAATPTPRSRQGR